MHCQKKDYQLLLNKIADIISSNYTLGLELTIGQNVDILDLCPILSDYVLESKMKVEGMRIAKTKTNPSLIRVGFSIIFNGQNFDSSVFKTRKNRKDRKYRPSRKCYTYYDFKKRIINYLHYKLNKDINALLEEFGGNS